MARLIDRRRLARLNHVLVPGTSDERDRYRKRGLGRVLTRVAALLQRFSTEAQPLLALAFMSAVFTLDVRRSQLYVAWGALAGLLGASLMCSVFYSLTGVRARILIARRVARAVPVRLTVAIDNDSDKTHHALRIRGPFLPWDGEWHRRAAAVGSLAPSARTRVELEAAFHLRGEHQLDPFRVQALVPLGLALGAALRTESPRFLVVPNVATLTSLAVPRTRRHHAGGIPRASHTADSRELAGVRPYRPGDAVRDLHPRTWARTGVPHVREYQEEYFSHLAVVADAGPSADARALRRPAALDAPLEAALSVAGGVLAKLLAGEALVDLLVLGHGRASTALGRGRGTLEAALDRMASIDRAASVDIDLEVARLVAMRERLSGVIMILSAWDESRAALVSRLDEEGLQPLVIVCAETAASLPARARKVAPDAVLRGEAIAL